MSSTTKARDYLEKARQLFGEGAFGDKRANQLVDEALDAIFEEAGPSPVDGIKALVMAVGLMTADAKCQGFRVAEQAGLDVVRNFVLAMENAIEAAGRQRLFVNDVAHMFGSAAHLYDTPDKLPDSFMRLIIARILRSSLWWAQLTDDERAAFSDDDALPHELWKRAVGEEGCSMTTRPPWLEDTDDRVVELGLWVQDQLDEGRTLRQIAQSQSALEELVDLDRTIREMRPMMHSCWSPMTEEVTDMTGPECDYYWDDEAELPNDAGYAYIRRRVLESCRWWARLLEIERAAYRTQEPDWLPYEFWRFEGPDFVDTPEEGAA